MNAGDDNLLSVTEAAGLLKVSAVRVRELINAGRLPARKVGRAFVLRRGDVTGLERMDPGRPRKTEETTAKRRPRK